MKIKPLSLLVLLFCLTILVSCESNPAITSIDYPIAPVDFTQVKLNEGFWKDWVETVHDETIPFAFQKCEETGRIDNFIFAGGLKEGKFQGNFGFNDSDLYKIMEGAAYALMIEDDPELAAYLDSMIYYVSEAQEEDGYLYTPWTLKANEYNDFTCCTYGEEGQWIETQNHPFYQIVVNPASAVYDADWKEGSNPKWKSDAEVVITKGDNIYAEELWISMKQYNTCTW